MNSYDSSRMTKVSILLLLSLPIAHADKVCTTSASGTTVCQSKLTPSTLTAIIVTLVLLVVLLAVAVTVFLYRRRQFAAAKAAVAAKAYVIEASQMHGPVPFTTYSATYDLHSAPPGLPAMPQTAPTTYGKVMYPFPGYSSPKGTTPRADSATSGTYTAPTLSAKAAV